MRALVRSQDAASAAIDQAVTLIQGSLEDSPSLQQLATGADCVVHCAGRVRGSRPSDFNNVNVAGTRRLLEAIADCPVPAPRMINLSSLAAREPQLSYYAASKFSAEQLASDHFSDLHVINLRPSPVYGPGDTEMLPLFRAMAKGFALVPGSTDARMSLIYVDDLVAAIVACIETEPGLTGVFEVDDGCKGGYDWTTIARIAEELCGRKVRLLRIPSLLLDGIASCNRFTAQILGYLPMLTPEKLRELRHPDWVCDSTALQAATAWRPSYQLAAGLARSPGWR